MVPVPEPDLPLPVVAVAPTADLVARHAAFVRTLARRLCRSDADADDLAQDTWVEALRRPSDAWVAPEDRPDGWLARVAQRLAGRRARGERRRSDREARAAQNARDTRDARAHTLGTRLHDTSSRRVGDAALDASLEHALVLRDVADALVALDDDARRIVVARHFEGLELAVLAAREGVATSTLKLRLTAAYERLRKRLDDHAGGDRARWTHALIAATGGASLAPPTPPAPDTRAPEVTWPTPTHSAAKPHPAPLGAAAEALRALLAPFAAHLSPVTFFAMGLTLKLSALAAVGAVVATGLALRGSERGVEALAPLADDASLAAVGHAALDAAAVRTERTASPVAAEPGPAGPAPVDTRELSAVATVEVLVTDLDGAPAPGVEVLAAPWDGPLNRLGRTDERGAFTLRWRPGFGDPRVLVALWARGVFLGGLRALEAPAGSRRASRVAIDPALLPRGGGAYNLRLLTRAADDLKRRVERIELELDWSDLAVVGLSNGVATLERKREERDGPFEADAEQVGEGEVAFVSGPGTALEPYAQLRESLVSGTILDRSAISMGSISWVTTDEEPTAIIRGVVRDLPGLPAASARVRAYSKEVDDASPVNAVTDREGRFELRVPLGRIAVIAGTGPNPGSRAEVVLVEGDERTCDLTLDRGLALFGVARSGEVPLAGAHVEATVTRGDEHWLAIAVTDAEGRFVVPHCAAPSVDLDVFVPESGVPCRSRRTRAWGRASSRSWRRSTRPRPSAWSS